MASEESLHRWLPIVQLVDQGENEISIRPLGTLVNDDIETDEDKTDAR